MKPMKIVAATAAVLPFLLGAGNAHATLRIAVVRASDLVQNSPQYQASEAEIKAEFDKRKTALEAQGQKLSDDIQTFQQNADTMAPDARLKMQNDLITRENDFKFQRQKYQQDLQNTNREKTNQLMAQIQGVINDVAKKDGYDLVLQDPVYASSGIDITDIVLKQLKSESIHK